MALRPVPRENDWPLEIAEAAQAEFWCTIEVFIPGAKGEYNPDTGKFDPGEPDTILLTGRPARSQHLRSPLESFGAYERSVKRAYRFQIVPQASDPEITDSAFIRVLTAQFNPAIKKHIYSVTSTASSDHDALLSIEAESELGVPSV